MAQTKTQGEGLKVPRSIAGLPPGTEIGRFVVLEHLGAGGMGILYVAYDPKLDRKVALKLVRASPRSHAKTADLRQLREAQALAQLSHPNVVSVFEVGTHEDQIFLALEYIEGSNLEAWVQDENPSLRAIVQAFAKAGRGLVAAHKAGILHRDIKPENIMVGPGSRVRLVDFGLARAVDYVDSTTPHDPEESSESDDTGVTIQHGGGAGPNSLSSSVTQPGSIMGTPTYMASELLNGGSATEASDQYSFCVSLYKAIYGVPPYPIKTFVDLIKIKEGSLEVPVRGPNHAIPSWIRTVLARGLDPEPEKRFESMEALVDTLERDSETTLKRRLIAAAVLLIAVVGTAGLVTWAQERHARCEVSRTRLADVWGPEQRTKLVNAFAALDTPFATSSRPMIERGLDHYAQDWQGVFLDSCRATYVRGDQSEELFDLRNECLNHRLQDFESLIQVFIEVDQTLVERGLKAISNLPSLSPCSQNTLLRTAERRQLSPQAQKRLDQARSSLSKAKAHRHAARYNTAKELLEPLSVLVEEEALPGLEAEVLQQLGMIENSLGDSEAARKYQIQALTAALTAQKDEVAVVSLQKLAWIEGEHHSRFETAFEWLNMAKALAGRLGERPMLEARLIRDEGNMSAFAGQYSLAQRKYRESLVLLDRQEQEQDEQLHAEQIEEIRQWLESQPGT